MKQGNLQRYSAAKAKDGNDIGTKLQVWRKGQGLSLVEF